MKKSQDETSLEKIIIFYQRAESLFDLYLQVILMIPKD